MVISGGAGTLFGPIVGAALVVIMKNVASAYIVRWNFLLGAIFVAIVIFMPEGIVPGTARLWRWLRRPRAQARRQAESAAMSALAIANLEKSFGGLRVTRDRQSQRRAGRTAADHRPERRRQDHAVQPDHRRHLRPTAARSSCSTRS